MATWKHAGCVMVCCLLLGLLVACTPRVPGTGAGAPAIGDGGFLSGEPCGPSCFWGIVPGVTTEAEATQILKARGLIEKCEAYDNEAESGSRGIYCRINTGIGFRRGTDIVDSVGFLPFHRITMEDVIAKYGKPNAVWVTRIGIPEYPETLMILFYDNIRAWLHLPEQEGIAFEVESSTRVEVIGYLDTPSYSSPRDSLPSWNGYGEYQYIPYE
jgi:hypothetical protein